MRKLLMAGMILLLAGCAGPSSDGKTFSGPFVGVSGGAAGTAAAPGR